MNLYQINWELESLLEQRENLNADIKIYEFTIEKGVDYDTGELIDAERLGKIKIALERTNFAVVEIIEKINKLGLEQYEKLEHTGLYCRNKSAEIDAISKEIKRLQAKKKTAENSLEWCEKYLLQEMPDKQFKGQLITLTKREGKKNEIKDESILFKFLKKEKLKNLIDIKLSIKKNELNELIKLGRQFPGVEEVPTTTLLIK